MNHRLLDARPLRQGIMLFDDVLTTGKHFKSCERCLRTQVPEYFPITGLFIARRVLLGRSNESLLSFPLV